MPKVSRDSAAHWGYVLEGRVTFRFADREEVCEAGDAFLEDQRMPISELSPTMKR